MSHDARPAPDGAEDEPLPVVRPVDVEPLPPDARWLLRDLWLRAAVGVIGGPPKCCKTWLGLDMAISVASGTAALGRFATEQRGPTLVYLAEDSLVQVRDRIDGICRHRGLALADLDLHLLAVPMLRLDDALQRRRLTATVKALRPRLLLLDPLVRLHALDENNAQEVSRLLAYLRELQRTHDLAVVLVHHVSKKRRAQPGQALRGSSDLHAFGDSNAYLLRSDARLTLTLEHRAAASLDPVAIELVTDAAGAPHLELAGDQPADSAASASLADRVLDELRRAGTPLTREALRSRVRANNQRLGDVLDELAAAGRVRRSPKGWSAA